MFSLNISDEYTSIYFSTQYFPYLTPSMFTLNISDGWYIFFFSVFTIPYSFNSPLLSYPLPTFLPKKLSQFQLPQQNQRLVQNQWLVLIVRQRELLVATISTTISTISCYPHKSMISTKSMISSNCSSTRTICSNNLNDPFNHFMSTRHVQNLQSISHSSTINFH